MASGGSSFDNFDTGRASAIYRLRKAAQLGYNPMSPMGQNIPPPHPKSTKMPKPLEDARGTRKGHGFRLLQSAETADDEYDFCSGFVSSSKKPAGISQPSFGAAAASKSLTTSLPVNARFGLPMPTGVGSSVQRAMATHRASLFTKQALEANKMSLEASIIAHSGKDAADDTDRLLARLNPEDRRQQNIEPPPVPLGARASNQVRASPADEEDEQRRKDLRKIREEWRKKRKEKEKGQIREREKENGKEKAKGKMRERARSQSASSDAKDAAVMAAFRIKTRKEERRRRSGNRSNWKGLDSESTRRPRSRSRDRGRASVRFCDI